jgi:hypothetical protein
MENNQQEAKVFNDKNQNQDQQSSKQPKQEYHFSKTLGVLILLILLPIVFWKIKYPSYTYRYKMTVEVETPQGIKSGSSVVEVHTYQIPQSWAGIFGGNYSWMDIKGEGVFIEIEEGKTLFFLLGGGTGYFHAKYFMDAAFPYEGNKMKYYGTLKNAKGTLPKDKIQMVSAIDYADGKIAFQIVKDEQLKEVFGTDVKVKHIIVETTNDPLEWKIRELSMWNEIREYVQYMMTASSQRRGNSVWLIFSSNLI